MANSKAKCKWCGDYFQQSETIKVPAGRFCCLDHAIAFAQQEQEKERLKKIGKLYLNKGKGKRRSKAAVESDLSAMKRKAKEVCHKYIRERDKGKPCICCGKPLGDEYDAGHYKKAGNHSYTRYDEDNIHGQRRDCNRHKGGNESGMRQGMIDRIGEDRVDRIETLYHEPMRWTVEELKRIVEYYEQKLKELK